LPKLYVIHASTWHSGVRMIMVKLGEVIGGVLWYMLHYREVQVRERGGGTKLVGVGVP
jgi:hypothetical protein